MDDDFDCQRCGACCAQFRVSFYWAEADDAPGGIVPAALTRQVSPQLRCMAGTEVAPVRCIALEGKIGQTVGCSIYAQRSSTCKGVMPGDPQCLKARAKLFSLAKPTAVAICLIGLVLRHRCSTACSCRTRSFNI